MGATENAVTSAVAGVLMMRKARRRVILCFEVMREEITWIL
jgi:hypothetical protein